MSLYVLVYIFKILIEIVNTWIIHVDKWVRFNCIEQTLKISLSFSTKSQTQKYAQQKMGQQPHKNEKAKKKTTKNTQNHDFIPLDVLDQEDDSNDIQIK